MHDHLGHAAGAGVVHGGGAITVAGLGLYTVFWVVMVAAMMLPSAWPLLRLFTYASANQPRPGRALAAFVGGYLTVWTAFGVVALVLDKAVHETVDAVSWLAARPWLLAAATLALAGAFQLSGLKDRCLSVCRTPAAYLVRHYRRGAPAGFALGWDHGLFCLGCCCALMLVMFAVGVSDVWWMAILAALMAYEKVGRRGPQVAAVAGVAFLVLATVVLMHPPWLPAGLSAA